jgi:hypothetical protein
MHRNIIEHSDAVAFGCSHTWGTGVEANETWSYLLGAMNFGAEGVSADFVARIAPGIVEQYSPSCIYVLWPDWTRFEYQVGNEYKQSLPNHPDRIHFMEQATDQWLQDNFAIQQLKIQTMCQEHNIKLIEMTLYDLIPYIDHADRWPLSKLGHHYSPEWHGWVAEIFRKKHDEQA